MSGPGLFAGWCSRATREKSWAIEDRDHLLAARAAEADAPTKQCSPGNRVRNSTEWHIAGLRAGSLAKTRAGRRDASNLSLGQRLGDEHTTLPIFKWLKSSSKHLGELGHEEGPRLLDPGRCRVGSRALDSDVVLGEGKVQEPIPVLVYLLRHRFLFGPVLASHLGCLSVPGLLCQALEELVGGYLHVLCCVGVSCVLASLIPAHHIGRALHEGCGDGLRLLASRGAGAQGVQTLAQPRP